MRIVKHIYMFSTVRRIRFVKETANITKTDLRFTYETHCARPVGTETEISVSCVAGRIYFMLFADDKSRVKTSAF